MSRRGNIHNFKYLEKFRKNLRNQSTSAEATLWGYLKNKQLKGRKFRRQHSVGNYILDFYCFPEKIAIELDGAYHFTEEGRKKDEERDAYLQSKGITVLHFENKEVFNNLESLLAEIASHFNLENEA